jgi:L-lactate dehydrogenase (cytochrome)
LQTGKEKGWAYYASGGDDETTMRDNISAFHRIWLRPRILRNVSSIDTSTTLLNYNNHDGNPFTFPIYLSSVALQGLGHDDGEFNWIRACANQGINYLLPTLSSVSYDEMYAEASGLGMDFFFQLYVNQDRSLVEDMIKNAESYGCRALFVTVDAPQLGRRDRDRRMKTVDSSSVAQVQGNQDKDVPQDQGTTAAISSFIDPALSWPDIEWIMSITKMDIVLKGIQTGADAVMAKEMGVKGIVVSNHGGRQIDTARSGIEILPEVMEALEGSFSADELEDFHVLLDGGVRRGTDIFKAIALGARACGVGKPAAYAMSAYGQPGIEQMVGQLRDEFANVMQLMGCTTVAQIRKEGKEMCDIRNLATHIEGSPTDYHYQPVNVFTHGKPSPLFQEVSVRSATHSLTRDLRGRC